MPRHAKLKVTREGTRIAGFAGSLQDTRRFTVDRHEITLTQLCHLFRQRYNLGSADQLQIKWTDADGGVVMLASDSDLGSALSSNADKMSCIRLTLDVLPEPQPHKEKSGVCGTCGKQPDRPSHDQRYALRGRRTSTETSETVASCSMGELSSRTNTDDERSRIDSDNENECDRRWEQKLCRAPSSRQAVQPYELLALALLALGVDPDKILGTASLALRLPEVVTEPSSKHTGSEEPSHIDASCDLVPSVGQYDTGSAEQEGNTGPSERGDEGEKSLAEEVAATRQACMAILEKHLNDHQAVFPGSTYEEWVAQVHPENSSLTGIDMRFYLARSEHRNLWNRTVEPTRQVPPSNICQAK